MGLSRTLADFADEVGAVGAGPVCVRGGATQWDIGGSPDHGVREVPAPSGIVAFQPAEMTVRVGAGTTVDELHDILARQRQTTVLPAAQGATVGGLVVVGRNGVRSLRHGPVRDVLLQARYVSADGCLVTAGGPTVKNVTGFDLCRLLVGSLGTLGLLGELILRTRPLPEAQVWLVGEADPWVLVGRLYRPACVLSDGRTTWVQLEGYRDDVAAQAAVCRAVGLVEGVGPPMLPVHRHAGRPVDTTTFAARHPEAGGFIAEIGVGVVHTTHAVTRPPVPTGVAALQRRLRVEFDPTSRLNPGRDPLAV